MAAIDERLSAQLAARGVKLTLGGEPTFVPKDAEGPEWTYSAVGPTKLGYARAMAASLLRNALKGGVDFFTPGKSYPGELNPRWAIRLIANRDGSPIIRHRAKARPTGTSVATFRKFVARRLGTGGGWRRLRDPRNRSNAVWAVLLDVEEDRWIRNAWPVEAKELTKAEGPAGLRLPLHLLKEGVPRRALTIEWTGDRLAVFMPPFLQGPFLRLLDIVAESLRDAGIGRVEMQGYVPSDEAGLWTAVGLAADPGVLEVNLPACLGWAEYDRWIHAVTQAAAEAGLRPWKEPHGGFPEGTGGGNHLLWGGPSLDENPFFVRSAWLASILRYWQHHPSLAYLFTGCYVGASSQAPRADESARDLHDLEMAWSFLENLGTGDHRLLIGETLRHLQTDVTGNSHRSEVSLDKFWNVGWPAGTLGLLEFRAIESLPRADWMSAVALLWSALAAHLLEHPFRAPVKDYAGALHDRFFLPSFLLEDLGHVLSDLAGSGYRFDLEMFRAIWDWKFPAVLEFEHGDARIEVRRAHESWPLLCETPVDGGTTSRFVDTSIQRLEFRANAAFSADYEVRVAGRKLPLREATGGFHTAGLRFRRTNLYPSLHPGLPVQMPLEVDFVNGDHAVGFVWEDGSPGFASTGIHPARAATGTCRTGRPGEWTFDLRLR